MSKRIFWLLFSLVLLILNSYCLRINLNADSLFPYRYAHALLEYQTSHLVVQPGMRIFPEWLYGLIGYMFTTDMILWSRVVILINTLILGLSLVFFFHTLNFERKQSLLYTSIMLLTVPILNLLHLNVLVYLVFSPGIHGFMIPYAIICLAILFRWLINKEVSVSSAAVFILIGGVVISSNINFIIMLLAPAAFVCVFILIKDRLQKVIVIKIFGVLACSLFAGLLLTQLIYNSLDQMIFLRNQFSFFQQSILDWMSGNELFYEMTSLNRSGYFFYILIASSLLSCWFIFKQRYKKTEPIYLLNVYVVSIFPIFMFVAWAVDKSLLRLMPHVIFFCQGLLFVNLGHAFAKRINLNILILTVLMAGIVVTVKYYSDKSPYIQHHSIISFLDGLRANGEIKEDGLSDYWIGNALLNSNNTLLPIHYNGLPMLYAIDANAFWEKGGKERKIDHIVNTKTRSSDEWILNEKRIARTFGEWSSVKKYELKNRMYSVYIYPNGINTEAFYQSIESELNRIRSRFE